MSSVESGAILTPRSVIMTITSTLVSLYLIRLGYRLPMLAGMACIVGTMLLLSQGWKDLSIGGLLIGTFPLLARHAHRAAFVRSFRHPVGNHEQAISHVLTGGSDPNGQQQTGSLKLAAGPAA